MNLRGGFVVGKSRKALSCWYNLKYQKQQELRLWGREILRIGFFAKGPVSGTSIANIRMT